MEDVLGYLQSKNLHLKRASEHNVNTTCFFCKEAEGKRGRLYINVNPDAEMPGLYMCHLCGAKGNIYSLRRHFGDKISDHEVVTENRWKILKEATRYYNDCLSAHVGATKYLVEGRGFTEETINQRKLGYGKFGLLKHLTDAGYTREEVIETGLVMDRSQNLVETLHGRIIIPYITAGAVSMLRGRAFDDQDGPKYKTPPGSKGRLYNTDVTWGAEQVTVVEGEFNAIMLGQKGIAAVGLPGAASFQPEWKDYFSEAKRVQVVFDNDEAGKKGAEKVKGMLGDRARITLLDTDPNEFFLDQTKTPEDFAAMLQGNEPRLLVTVDEAYKDFLVFQNARGLRLGIDDIDSRIYPGLLPAQVMIILARTGVGKTLTLLNTFHRLSALHPEAKVLFLSLEQTRGEWFERARRITGFYDMEGWPDEWSKDSIDTYQERTATRTLDHWRQRLLMIDQNRLTEAQFRQCLDEYGERMGQLPDLVAVDYLGYWAQSYTGEAYSRLTQAVMALKAIAKDYKIPILAPHQVNRSAKGGAEFDEDAARDAGTIGETADFIFGIWNPDHAIENEESQKNEVTLKILKSRHGGRGKSASLYWSPLSLTLVPQEDPMRSYARAEPQYEQYRDKWYGAHYRHRTGKAGPLTELYPDE